MRLIVNFIIFIAIIGISVNTFPSNLNLADDYNWQDGFGARGTDDAISEMVFHKGNLLMYSDFSSIRNNIVRDLARYDEKQGLNNHIVLQLPLSKYYYNKSLEELC